MPFLYILLIVFVVVFFLYCVFKITINDDEPPPDSHFDFVVYYDGYPSLKPMQDGRLQISDKGLLFSTKDLEETFLAIPYDRIVEVDVELEDLSEGQRRDFKPSELLGAISGPSLTLGTTDMLLVDYIDESNTKHTIRFATRNKRAIKLKELILGAMIGKVEKVEKTKEKG